jgi:hypothetical protein
MSTITSHPEKIISPSEKIALWLKGHPRCKDMGLFLA